MTVTKLGPKLLSWATEIDENTIEQARETASMPFVVPHVALMPDAHSGRGAAVGTVIPTDGSVVPASVGVDIGCFRGDTRVPLLNGTQRSLKDMTEDGGTYWVYSLDDDRQIVPGRAIAKKTRTDAELMRVTVSGGDEIICTLDHPFMMNDGTYREARLLRFNDSLMPLYRRWQTRDGYESVSAGKGNTRQTHVLMYETLNGPVPEGHVVHHVNHIHFDNRPENLAALEASEHSRYHRQIGHKFDNTSPDLQEKRLLGIRRANADPARQARMVVTGTANITRYMDERPEHFRAAVAGNGERGAPYLAQFNVTPRACDDCGETSPNPAALRWHKQREHGHNHKVISVEFLTERSDVYCLEVDQYHNFALAAGVFVHNCGMSSIETRYTATDLGDRDLSVLRAAIEGVIPLSVGNYNTGVERDHTAERIATLEEMADRHQVDLSHSPKWREQLGSLGSGNHFIELCLDERDHVWLFLHSGSRGVGNKIAQKHIKIAQKLCKQWWIALPNPELAYLVQGTHEFTSYIKDLNWAQKFAALNREDMLDRFGTVFASWLGADDHGEVDRITSHHNYTRMEHHMGRDVWLTRKGAVDAHKGVRSMIPGSMGTCSYVVEGKGNPAALHSAPHGAGRRMSRTEAKKRFTAEDLADRMKGIEYRHGEEWVDEIPDSYKPIDEVMAAAEPLVTVLHELRQVMNCKGT